tara:strand:+ start:30517 stop:31503 length:987 start_codon:yes stop_codon:yes gene_type:complete
VDLFKNLLHHSTDELLGLLFGVTVFFITLLVAYWWYNRKKFHQLSHQIPASVVKNYLDSIITNSNALKSSLFRGGGLDLGEGTPSVMPASELPKGNVSMGGASSEELSQKNAEIARLKATVLEKDKTIEELERMLAAARDSNGGGISDEEANIMKGEITNLQGKLEQALSDLEAAKASSGGDGGDVAAVTKERDELKERLQEYEVIEEDLANIKKFQQENEQLRKTIEQLQAGGATPAAETAPEPEAAEAPKSEDPEPILAEEMPPAPEAEPEEVAEAPAPAEEAPAAEPVSEEEATSEAEDTPEVPSNEGEQKSAEELLSEFEKMLG